LYICGTAANPKYFRGIEKTEFLAAKQVKGLKKLKKPFLDSDFY